MSDLHDANHPAHSISPRLLIFCGAIGLIGSVMLAVGNIVGSMVVPGHDWVADTVSDLAAGEHEIIQDFSLYGYAAALIACAIGAAHYHLGRGWWSIGVLSLTLLALLVTLVGARNEYGDGDDEGLVLHIYFVYGLGVLFTVAPFAMARGMGIDGAVYRWIAWITGAFWAIGAPIFFFLPTEWDGAWERGLGVVTMVFIMALSVLLIQAGQDVPDPQKQATRNADVFEE